MKQTLAVLLAASAWLWSNQPMYAQETDTPPPHGPRPPRHAGADQLHGRRMQGPPLIAALDANRDGTLDAAELANAPAGLKTLDKNGDGQISGRELGPMPPNAPRPPRRPAPPIADNQDGESTPPAPDVERPAPPRLPALPWMTALDINQDRVLDTDEITNAAAALRTLDQNQDGQLTPDEYRPHPPHVRHPGPGHRPHPPAPRGLRSAPPEE